MANAFKGNDAVVFDLFNEPYPDAPATGRHDHRLAAAGATAAPAPASPTRWPACRTWSTRYAPPAPPTSSWSAAWTWTNDLTQWLTYKPTDPRQQLWPRSALYNFNTCVDRVLLGHPARAGGRAGAARARRDRRERLRATTSSTRLMNWADAHGVGYLGWTWNTWGCSSGAVPHQGLQRHPDRGFGEGYKAHLLTQNP